mgnify:FL=1
MEGGKSEIVKKELLQAGMLDVLKDYNEEDRVVSSHELHKELQEERAKRPRMSFTSPFPSLEKLLSGLRPGELVVVSGPTGGGKTLLCQTFTKHLVEHAPLWFTYEVVAEDFFDRFENDLPIFYLPRKLKTRSIDWIAERAKEIIVKYGTKIIFIDHLHYLLDMNRIARSQSISLEIGSVLRELKQLAIANNLLVFLVAHTMKSLAESATTLEDLRDSSFVSQESDTVLFVWRKRKKQKTNEIKAEGILYEDESVVSVQKNRRTGRLGSLPLMFQNGRFYEKDLFANDAGVNADVAVNF